MSAEELIEAVAATQRDAVALATIVSPAVRVEPYLLRRARLTLLPGRPASAESELWFGPLVSSSSPRALVLRADVAAVLRNRLVEHDDPTLPERAHALITAAHAGGPPTLRLEEDVIWAALTEGPGAANAKLGRAVATMLGQPGRGRGLARWARRAVPALPTAARLVPAAQALRAAADMQMDSSSRRAFALPAELAWLALVDSGERVPVGVRLLDGGIEVSEPPLADAHVIELPRTEPLALRLGTVQAPDAVGRVEIPGGAVTTYAVDPASGAERRELALTLADGTMYRLRETVGREARVALAGSAVQLDPSHRRIGDVDPDEPMEISVYLSSPRTLDWVDEQATLLPAARRVLSRAEFSREYGRSARDISDVEAFLTGYGIAVTGVDVGRRCVSASGPAGAVAEAFGVSGLGLYEHPTAGVYRRRQGPLHVPMDLNRIIVGVLGIDELWPEIPGFRPLAASAETPTGYSPAEIARAYNFPVGVTGAGQTIGIIAAAGPHSESDVAQYFEINGLRSPEVTTVVVRPSEHGADPSVTMSIQILGSVAPRARLVVYVTEFTERGMVDAVSTAVHDAGNAPSVITVGFGAPEVSWTRPGLTQLNAIMAEAAALGVTVTVSAGNDGATGGVGDGGYHVDFPASAPYALACGGTRLDLEGGDAAESAWAVGGGGASRVFAVPPHQQGAERLAGGRPGRGVPDVAAAADPTRGYRVVLDGRVSFVGGTAQSAALWAGLCALLNEALGRPVGFLAPLLYSPSLRHALRDIVTGETDGYTAHPGWDPCTGLGSPDGTLLLEALGGAPARAAPAESSSRASEEPSAELDTAARAMFALMMQHVASRKTVFHDPQSGKDSVPGFILASPYTPTDPVNSYLFNWVRDAAIVAMEIAAGGTSPEDVEALADYVNFAALCQGNARPTLGHSCFAVDGTPRPWTEQNDGPALQTLAILKALWRLDEPTQENARGVIARNLEYLLSVYLEPTTNMWEESTGYSFFARAVQLRCFQECISSAWNVPTPAGLNDAIAWLEDALQTHWTGTYYSTLIPTSRERGYDPNMDVVMASVYGAVPCTDPKLLSTAGLLRRVWTDPRSVDFYPINATDGARGVGPLLGRYPGDRYSLEDPGRGGHPWTHCTCSFAELYYRLASEIARTGAVPLETLSMEFFGQIDVGPKSSPADAVCALRAAGDRMLQAVVLHSDDHQLSEQFDAETGFVRGAPSLAWAYAAFLSALRARSRGEAAMA